MRLIVDCAVCDEHSLHIIGEEGSRTYQCLNCGYASADKFSGEREKHPEYKKLTDEMREWSVQTEDRWYIPSIITLQAVSSWCLFVVKLTWLTAAIDAKASPLKPLV